MDGGDMTRDVFETDPQGYDIGEEALYYEGDSDRSMQAPDYFMCGHEPRCASRGIHNDRMTALIEQCAREHAAWCKRDDERVRKIVEARNTKLATRSKPLES